MPDPDLIPRNKRVVEHNSFIRARFDFDVVLHRLFIAALLQLNREDDELENYCIPVRELVDVFGASTRLYSDLKETAEEMVQRSTMGFENELPGGRRKFVYYPLFRKISYAEGEGHIEIGFNPELRDRLLDLKGNFTRYELKHVRNFGSTYSFRIYKWLKGVEDYLETLEVSLKEMRTMLMLEDKYPNFAHFRRRVLEKAQEELDEHADISFEWEPIKEGRKVTAIRFLIRLSKNTRASIPQLLDQGKTTAPRSAPMELDAFDKWWHSLDDETQDAYNDQAEKRLVNSEATGKVREVERMVALREIFREETG